MKGLTLFSLIFSDRLMKKAFSAVLLKIKRGLSPVVQSKQKSIESDPIDSTIDSAIDSPLIFLTPLIFFIFLFTANSNADQQPKICSEIHKLLILRQQGHAPSDFVVEYKDIGGGGDSYPHLDIDGDGIDDSIVRSCGAGIDGLCFLFVKLSSGKEFELEEEKFFLARVKSNIYVVLGESLSQPEMAKLGKRRAYQITNQTIKLICPHF